MFALEVTSLLLVWNSFSRCS